MALVRRWWWLQILIGGVLLLYFVERVLLSSQDPVFIPSVMLIGAFLVPVVFVTYLYEHMPDWDVPLSALATCFVWGGAIGTVVAGALEFGTLLSLGVAQLLGVGLIEESVKLIFPLIFYFLGRYRSEADGIILGVSTAMGFAALETMGYSFVTFLQSGGDLLALDEVLFVRGLLSPTNHAAWTGLVCAVLFRERLRAGREVLNHRVVGAFLMAVVLTGTIYFRHSDILRQTSAGRNFRLTCPIFLLMMMRISGLVYLHTSPKTNLGEAVSTKVLLTIISRRVKRKHTCCSARFPLQGALAPPCNPTKIVSLRSFPTLRKGEQK